MSILRDRLEPLAEIIIGDYHARFRKGISTTGQIFAVKQILEMLGEEYNPFTDIHRSSASL
jgi:hypothetical protein